MICNVCSTQWHHMVNQIKNLTFSAVLTLLVGQQEEYPTCKIILLQQPERIFFVDLWVLVETGVISRKIVQSHKNQEYSFFPVITRSRCGLAAGM